MQTQKSKKRSVIILILFLVALSMGAGPGVYLVNDTEHALTLFGIPLLYVWVVFWYFVMTIIVLVAANTVWKNDESDILNSADSTIPEERKDG